MIKHKGIWLEKNPKISTRILSLSENNPKVIRDTCSQGWGSCSFSSSSLPEQTPEMPSSPHCLGPEFCSSISVYFKAYPIHGPFSSSQSGMWLFLETTCSGRQLGFYWGPNLHRSPSRVGEGVLLAGFHNLSTQGRPANVGGALVYTITTYYQPSGIRSWFRYNLTPTSSPPARHEFPLQASCALCTHQAMSPADSWCQVTAAPCPVEAASQALSPCLSNGLKWPSRDWLQGESTLAGWSWSLNIQGLEQMSKQSWFDFSARHPCLKVRSASPKAEAKKSQGPR